MNDKDRINKEKNPLIKGWLHYCGEVTAFYDFEKSRAYIKDMLDSDERTLLYRKTSNYQDSKNISVENNWNLHRDRIKNIKNNKTEESLKNITTPILIIHGSHDSIPASNAKHMARLIPNATCVIMENTAHCLFAEKPKEFHQLVSTFLDRTDSMNSKNSVKI